MYGTANLNKLRKPNDRRNRLITAVSRGLGNYWETATFLSQIISSAIKKGGLGRKIQKLKQTPREVSYPFAMPCGVGVQRFLSGPVSLQADDSMLAHDGVVDDTGRKT